MAWRRTAVYSDASLSLLRIERTHGHIERVSIYTTRRSMVVVLGTVPRAGLIVPVGLASEIEITRQLVLRASFVLYSHIFCRCVSHPGTGADILHTWDEHFIDQNTSLIIIIYNTTFHHCIYCVTHRWIITQL